MIHPVGSGEEMIPRGYYRLGICPVCLQKQIEFMDELLQTISKSGDEEVRCVSGIISLLDAIAGQAVEEHLMDNL